MRYATCRYERANRSDSRSTFRDACPAERRPCFSLSGRIKTNLRPRDFRAAPFSCFKCSRWSRKSYFPGLEVRRQYGSFACFFFRWFCCWDISTRTFFRGPCLLSCKAGFTPCCLEQVFLSCRFCRKHHGSRPAWKAPRPIFCCFLCSPWGSRTFCSRQPARCCNRGTRARGSARFPTVCTHSRMLGPCWLS